MKKSFPFILIIFILTSSCIKDTLNIADTGRKITINGLISSDSLLNVRVSKSAYMTDIRVTSFDSLFSIDNAKVLIFKNDVFVDTLVYYAPNAGNFEQDTYTNGNYLSKNLIPVPGNKYKIVVNAPGFPEATSTTTIPDLVKIELVDTSGIIVPFPYQNPLVLSNEHLTCNVEFTDPGNETNYYLFSIFKVYKSWGHEMCNTVGFVCNDPIVEEKFTSSEGSSIGINAIRGVAFSDKIINGQKCSLSVTFAGIDLGLPFYNGNPDTSDPDNSDPDDHKKSVYFRLYSITEEYYKYLQTLNKYSKNYDNPLSDPVQVYSNVSGGYGIFAGAAVSSDSLVFTY